MRTARLAGHYYNMLGTSIVLGMIVGPILRDSMNFDLSFILYFLTGFGILNGRRGWRTAALILNSLAVLFCVGYLVSLLWATGPVGGGGELRTPQLAAFHASAVLILFLPPLILLLLPATRRWFAESRVVPPPRYTLTGSVVALYVLAACPPIAAGVALERSTRTAATTASCGAFSFADGRTGIVAAGWMEDKETERPLFITWLAYAEADSYSSPVDGHVSFGSRRIAIPNHEPIRYLGWPPDAERPAEILLVRQDGTVTRLARRVTPDQLRIAQGAGDGANDFDQLQQRLEALLPKAE